MTMLSPFRLPRLQRLVVFIVLLVSQACVFAADECAVATAHPLATRAGCHILEQGGTAFDAAVAVTAALAVVEPYSSGIGGGGFYLLHRAVDGTDIFVDARETAPGRVTPGFYVDESGAPRERLSLEGPTAAGIPGIPAALDWIATRYGTLPLAKTVASAVRLAQQGFAADSRYAWASGFREALLNKYPRAAAVFLDHGKRVAQGHVIRQPQLAATLQRIAAYGRDGFYRGDVARKMVDAVQAAGGLWTLQDLEGYRVVEREPFRFDFHGARIITAPLPSSGGLVMAEAFNVLSLLHFEQAAPTQRMHFIVEAMRRGYNDRARYMGDPDFVRVPVAKLASRAYAGKLAASIDPDHATPSSALPAVADPVDDAEETTHFSIIDRFGNRVAATLSVNGPFGSGFIAGDTGVLLNNHMNDFSLATAAPNLYKLVGNEANAIAPGKRPLSSMSPTFVVDDRGVLVLGTPGGSRIISMVVLGVLDYLFTPEVDVQRIVTLPRYHHQYLPDRVEIEPEGFDDARIGSLRAKGHMVETGRRRWGNMQAVFLDSRTGRRSAASDPRGRAGVLF